MFEKISHLPIKIIFVAALTASVLDVALYLTLPKVPDSTQKEILAQETSPLPTPQSSKESVNVLLVGYGGGNHSGGGLADAIILMHIDPNTQKASLIHIPRDAYVPLKVRSDMTEYFKINEAFAIGNSDSLYPFKQTKYTGSDGGGLLLGDAVTVLTGLPVNLYIAVNFDSFKGAIDALDGVSVEVPVTFTDSYYPIAGKENELCDKSPAEITKLHQLYSGFELEKQFTCRYEELHFEQGQRDMDGETALKFVRSRHSGEHGGDFARGQRQIALLKAVEAKIISLGYINKLPTFFNEFKGFVSTNINLNQASMVAEQLGHPQSYSISEINLSTDNVFNDSKNSSGQYILLPKAGNGNFDGVQEFIQSNLN